MIVAEDALNRAVSAVPTYDVSDGWFQLTPLRGPKIVGILQSDFGSNAFPIYSAAQLKRKTLGRYHSEQYDTLFFLVVPIPQGCKRNSAL